MGVAHDVGNALILAKLTVNPFAAILKRVLLNPDGPLLVSAKENPGNAKLVTSLWVVSQFAFRFLAHPLLLAKRSALSTQKTVLNS